MGVREMNYEGGYQEGKRKAEQEAERGRAREARRRLQIAQFVLSGVAGAFLVRAIIRRHQ